MNCPEQLELVATLSQTPSSFYNVSAVTFKYDMWPFPYQEYTRYCLGTSQAKLSHQERYRDYFTIGEIYSHVRFSFTSCEESQTN